MEPIKTADTSPEQPASACPETPRSTPSQPTSSPTTAPYTAGSRKRKLDVEDTDPHKRLQVEPPTSPPISLPVSPPVSLPAALPGAVKTNPQTQGNIWDHESHAEGFTQTPTRGTLEDNHQQAQQDTRDDEPHNRYHDDTDSRYQATDSRDHEAEDPLLDRPQAPPTARLSKANLKQLQQEVIALEEMNNTGSSSDRGRKRTLSGHTTMSRTSVSDLASTRTKEPIPSHAFYRFNVLHQANVCIVTEDPPPTLQTQLDTIFKRKVSKERKGQISAIAKEKSLLLSELLRGAHREDDLVELVHEILFAMHKDNALTHPRKADWIHELKPRIQQQQFWNFDIPHQRNAGLNNASDHLGKRQQTDQSVSSPDASQSEMPPPPVPSLQPQSIQDAAIKTPRPDFTCGFRTSTVTNALQERGLSELRAHSFLEALQLESKLYSNPTQQSLKVRFPILVLEGKAYATGKTLFEAENQAAVSGSAMLILQRQLEVLHDTIVLSSNAEREKSPVAFSLCTEGPILELWVHYIVTQEGTTTYCMDILATCHASICDELERFLSKTDCLIEWYKNEYLREVVDQLLAIANHAAR
ncbi:MAG: hypothetical protein Q9168_005005 [Polycauliona sp. 1 TL-2023]